ncbi:HET-domain-containing protein [Pyrenophora teres f. teres]|uniref:HET-domain-containing protein n=1 Tax=Pyrenophora teres f. teres TaxID=97479 RepID=A0A6S6WHK8_9PLEO|nr:HET-domain-containing protein [Pyrenophora teres f. teres]
MLPENQGNTHHTGSDHSLRCAQSWLLACTRGQKTSSALPTRVVHIKGSQDVRLYQSKREVKKYVCLSHCWGGVEIIRTKNATLTQYEKGIPWEDLSLTFQEAITFAFRLGYEYIWIDSLCIIQDNVEDWRLEGSRMSQIYTGAALTLAATASSDGSGGCFRRHERPALTHVSYPAADGSKMRLGVRLGVENTNWHGARLPLLGRAWAFQERLLSHRVLHFLEEELLWECRHNTSFELFAQGNNVWEHEIRHSTSSFKSILSLDKIGIVQKWQEIICQYSALQLTEEDDIFPALQGIGKYMSEYIRSNYLAGLWEIDLIEGLLWYTTSHIRPLKWRSTSWSWASMLGPVTWDSIAWDRFLFTPYTSLVSTQIEPVDSDTFGALKSGRITLRGRCFNDVDEGVFCTTPTEHTGNVMYMSGSTWMYKEVRYIQDCKVFDGVRPHSKPLVPGQRVKTLLMGDTGSGWTYHFLVLRPVTMAENTYERFAYMMLGPWDFAPGGPRSLCALGEEEIIHII